MKKQWTVTAADGMNHVIEYKGRSLLVDGQKYPLAPAMVAVFALGIFSKKITPKAYFGTITKEEVVGCIMGDDRI